MSEEFLAKVRAEIASLEAALARDPIYRRLQVLRAVLKEYGEAAVTESSQSIGYWQNAATPRRQASQRKSSPERERALDFARAYLRDATTPTPTREIFRKMEEAGIRLGGANQQNNLSAILSNSEDFKSYGRSGWMLIKAADKLVADDAQNASKADATPAHGKETDDWDWLKS